MTTTTNALLTLQGLAGLNRNAGSKGMTGALWLAAVDEDTGVVNAEPTRPWTTWYSSTALVATSNTGSAGMSGALWLKRRDEETDDWSDNGKLSGADTNSSNDDERNSQDFDVLPEMANFKFNDSENFPHSARTAPALGGPQRTVAAAVGSLQRRMSFRGSKSPRQLPPVEETLTQNEKKNQDDSAPVSAGRLAALRRRMSFGSKSPRQLQPTEVDHHYGSAPGTAKPRAQAKLSKTRSVSDFSKSLNQLNTESNKPTPSFTGPWPPGKGRRRRNTGGYHPNIDEIREELACPGGYEDI